MAASWNVLVVDDEEDVHNITRLALRRKTWRGRSIELTSARSGAEARQILLANDRHYDCALVDVVMESNEAGLELCDFIRTTLPRTTRIVLRTGQPGAAPPDRVMNDYDIDYYLAKTEVTEERLFMTLRACFRASLDIASFIAVGDQLRAFTTALQDAATTRGSLAAIMVEGLRFLEEKHGAKMLFVDGVDAISKAARRNGGDPQEGEAFVDRALAARAIAEAHAKKLAPMQVHPGPDVGLPSGTFVIPLTQLVPVDRTERTMGEKVKLWFQNLMKDSAEAPAAIGLVVRFERALVSREQQEFVHDLELFVANWRVADSSLRLQDRIVRERVEMMKSFGSV